MTKLPRISGRECVKALAQRGFYLRRRDDPLVQVVVPDHKELDRGTLRAIIRQAGLCVDEFIDLM